MPIADEIIDGIHRRGVHLDDFEDDVAARVERLLQELEQSIADQINAYDITGLKRGSYREARLRQLLEQTRESLDDTYRSILDVTRASLTHGAELEATFATTLLRSAFAPASDFVDVNTVAISPDLLRALADEHAFALESGGPTAPVADWLLEQEAKVRAAIFEQMRVGVAAGDSIPHLVQRIRGGGGFDGVLKVARNWAESVVRTSVQAVLHEARHEVYFANDNVVKGIYQVSTRDDRTTIVCLVYHGKRWLRIGGVWVPDGHTLPFNGGIPRHVRCRSSECPWTKSAAELGFQRDEMSSALWNYLDGKVPARLNPETLLGSQSDAAQDEILGATRAAMWRKGQIDLRDLLDDRGRLVLVKNL